MILLPGKRDAEITMRIPFTRGPIFHPDTFYIRDLLDKAAKVLDVRHILNKKNIDAYN
jgi:hypothetical protein